MAELDLARSEQRLTLIYTPRRVSILLIALLFAGLYGAAIYGMARRFDGTSLLQILLLGGVCACAIVHLVFLARLRPVVGVTTSFDLKARRVGIQTRRERGPDELVDIPFDQAKELRLLERKSRRAELLTLSLTLADGRTIALGSEQVLLRDPSTRPGPREMVGLISQRTGIASPTTSPSGHAGAYPLED